MMNEDKEKKVLDYWLSGAGDFGSASRGVMVCDFSEKDVSRLFSVSTFFNGFIVCMALCGTAEAVVNYRRYDITEKSLLIINPVRLFCLECRAGFRMRCLMVRNEFAREMDSLDMISRRTKYGVRLFSYPAFSLSENAFLRLYEMTEQVRKSVELPQGNYYKEIINVSLNLFYLHLSDIIDKHFTLSDEKDFGMKRNESVVDGFITLLIDNFRERHTVDFYAEELNLSTRHLTLIVKRITGKSVSDLIYDMIYNEAKSLLAHSKLTIQEISMQLHFSDQSAFRKFFVRKSGVSPKVFRMGGYEFFGEK